jgi:hypothetical protein
MVYKLANKFFRGNFPIFDNINPAALLYKGLPISTLLYPAAIHFGCLNGPQVADLRFCPAVLPS